MRTIKLIIHINVHKDGSRFYEWELRGARRDEAQQIMNDLAKDLQSCQHVIVKSEYGIEEE